MPETEASSTPKLHFSKLSPPQQPLHTPRNQTTVVPKPIPHSIHLSSLTTKIIKAHDHFHTKKERKKHQNSVSTRRLSNIQQIISIPIPISKSVIAGPSQLNSTQSLCCTLNHDSKNKPSTIQTVVPIKM